MSTKGGIAKAQAELDEAVSAIESKYKLSSSDLFRLLGTQTLNLAITVQQKELQSVNVVPLTTREVTREGKEGG